jgi:hypothetical protein
MKWKYELFFPYAERIEKNQVIVPKFIPTSVFNIRIKSKISDFIIYYYQQKLKKKYIYYSMVKVPLKCKIWQAYEIKHYGSTTSTALIIYFKKNNTYPYELVMYK